MTSEKRVIKPKKRSKFRLFLGKSYYQFLRHWQWYCGKTKFALHKGTVESFQYCIARHQTPLYRPLPKIDMGLQRNKVINLNLAISKLDRIVLKPGETFSFWWLVGKPSKTKGFVNGMVLFNGKVMPGIGGGLCQLSNLIYWLTLHTPLTFVERWRHSYDVFPDANRNQPFGSGATVSYNHIDLQIRNDTSQNFLLHLFLTKDSLKGEWRSNEPVPYSYKIYEKAHQITHEPWDGYVRHNKIYRFIYNKDGCLVDDEFITENNAIMMYQPFLEGGTFYDL